MKLLADNEYQPVLVFSSGSLINRVRNDLVSNFIDSDCDMFIFIDSDISDFAESVLKMVQMQSSSIITIPYRKKQEKEEYNTNLKYSIEETLYMCPDADIAEIKHGGTGCMLIPRCVLQTLISNDNIKYIDDDKVKYNLFHSFVVDGKYLSEDYGFCHLCSLNNIKILALFDEISHDGYKGNMYCYLMSIIFN